MSRPTDPGRRRLLLGGAAVAAAALLGPRALAITVERLRGLDDPAQRLRSLVRHPESAAVLGRAYLAVNPDEASAPRLVALIAGSTDTADATATSLSDRIRAEFDAGELVRLDGWIVSRTEARLCALCALG